MPINTVAALPGSRPVSDTAVRAAISILRITTIVLAGAFLSTARGEDPTSAPSPHDQLHVRYAEARLTLAELDLEKATLLEQQGLGETVSDYDWRRLRSRVAVLRDVVEANREHPHGTGIHGQRARARSAVKIADEDLLQAKAIHERAPTPFSELAVRRFETKAEIARLRLALWDDPANVPSIIDEMQMQIDLLTDHVLDLLDEVDNDRIRDALRQ